MKMMRALALSVMILAAWPASAQSRTFHVFPQLADGFFGDGTFYRTTINVIPLFSDVTCSLVLWGGMTADFGEGAVSQLSISVQDDGFASVRTSGANAFSSGYGTLTCDSSTYANAIYSFYSSNGTKLSEATVFSSRESFSQELLVDGRDSARLGLAIANLTDLPRTYNLTLTDSAGTEIGTGSIEVSPRSANAKFVDEIMALPPETVLKLEIRPEDFSEFSSIGLRFTGGVFTTVPAN